MARFVKGDVVVVPFPFSDLPMKLPMNLQVGRVTPCAPQDRAWHPDGAHGVTPYRPERVQGRKAREKCREFSPAPKSGRPSSWLP